MTSIFTYSARLVNKSNKWLSFPFLLLIFSENLQCVKYIANLLTVFQIADHAKKSDLNN